MAGHREIRPYHLGVRLSEGERLILAMVARRDKRSIASWVRKQILTALETAERLDSTPKIAPEL